MVDPKTQQSQCIAATILYICSTVCTIYIYIYLLRYTRNYTLYTRCKLRYSIGIQMHLWMTFPYICAAYIHIYTYLCILIRTPIYICTGIHWKMTLNITRTHNPHPFPQVTKRTEGTPSKPRRGSKVNNRGQRHPKDDSESTIVWSIGYIVYGRYTVEYSIYV